MKARTAGLIAQAEIRSAHEAVGLHVEVSKIVRYDQMTHQLTVQLAWR